MLLVFAALRRVERRFRHGVDVDVQADECREARQRGSRYVASAGDALERVRFMQGLSRPRDASESLSYLIIHILRNFGLDFRELMHFTSNRYHNHGDS